MAKSDFDGPEMVKEESASLTDLRTLLREANRSLDVIVEKLRELNYGINRVIGDN